MGTIEVSPIADLEQVRGIIDKQFKGRQQPRETAGDENDPLTTATGNGDTATTPTTTTTTTNGGEEGVVVVGGGLDLLSAGLIKLSSDWCFVDSCTAERFFRVDRAQEHLHYLTDIANESLFVLDQDIPTMPPTPEDELVVQNALLQHQQLQNLSPSESR